MGSTSSRFGFGTLALFPPLAAIACAPLSSQERADTRAADLRDYLQRCERFGFAGTALVARGGKVLLVEGYGLADRERGVANTKDTLFEIASVTKSFTAVAILQLEAEGKLSTDDSIAEHLPGVPEGMRDITIYHLLTHTSGMPRMAGGGRGDDLEQAVAGYFSTPRARQPGVAHEYWNGGYALLAGIVERASGATYMEWCRDHIFAPAGMTSSGFTGDPFPRERIALGYEDDGPPRRADEHPYGSYGWHYRGMGGLVTSAPDLHRFVRALRDDTLLPESARKKLFTPFRDYSACGFYVLKEPRLEIGHEGDVRGFHAQLWSYPDDDACIVILGNVGQIPMWTMSENLRAILFGDPSRYPQPPATERWPAEELQKLAGVYERAEGERIEVTAEGDAVRLVALGPDSTRLLYIPRFGRAGKPDAELVRVAESVMTGITKGDAEPLRRHMNAGIPARWPDDVRDTYGPAHVQKWGECKAVRIAGAVTEGPMTTVLFALDHERGSSRVKIVLAAGKLQIFDLNGPQALATCRAVPAPQGRLARFAWQGEPLAPIELVRDEGKGVAALEVAGEKYRRVRT